jgi:hypothetical protein
LRTAYSVLTTKGREHFEDLDVDGGIISKQIFEDENLNLRAP